MIEVGAVRIKTKQVPENATIFWWHGRQYAMATICKRLPVKESQKVESKKVKPQ